MPLSWTIYQGFTCLLSRWPYHAFSSRICCIDSSIPFLQRRQYHSYSSPFFRSEIMSINGELQHRSQHEVAQRDQYLHLDATDIATTILSFCTSTLASCNGPGRKHSASG